MLVFLKPSNVRNVLALLLNIYCFLQSIYCLLFSGCSVVIYSTTTAIYNTMQNYMIPFHHYSCSHAQPSREKASSINCLFPPSALAKDSFTLGPHERNLLLSVALNHEDNMDNDLLNIPGILTILPLP